MSAGNKLFTYEEEQHEVFQTTVTRLMESERRGMLKVYDKQRAINEIRVGELIRWQNDMIRLTGAPKVRGMILVGSIKGDKTMYLLDGQHRYRVLTKMIESNQIQDAQLVIERVYVKTKAELHLEFKEINSCVPVPLHYLNPSEIVDRCFDILSCKYTGAFFNKGPKGKRPKMSMDTFKDALISEQVVSKLKITTAEELVEKIEKLHKHYLDTGVKSITPNKVTKAEQGILERGFKKCEEGDKFLSIGLFKNNEWIADLIDRENYLISF